MLTKIIGDRVYDFSHVVGGRDQVMGPVALDVAHDGEVFAITTKLDRGCNVARYSVGPNAGDEEVVTNIGSRGEEPGQVRLAVRHRAGLSQECLCNGRMDG